ncbi:MAG: ABC transporter substrate-binding protein [Labilithrix sp.]|nr:ABC transporter substrate-binding protein [Labilithrix sp.]
MRRTLSILGVFLFAFAPSCSSTFHAKVCSSDDDCGAGLVCAEHSASAMCLDAKDAPLRIGMSAPISGPSQDLGTEMKKGLLLAFDAQNAAGGIRGRKIELSFRDDEYRPQGAEAAAHELLDVARANTPARCPTTSTAVVTGEQPVANGALLRGPNAVLGLVGNVGTPTMVRSAPIAVETGSLFFGAFTGAARVLRDGLSGPCSRYIFNVRASYAQEARATLEFFFKQRVPDARHLVSFDQNDSFGQAGYDGLVAAYTATRGAPDVAIKRYRYTRDDESSVPAQVEATSKALAQILASDGLPHVVGILMTDTYGPAMKYIRGLRDWQYANDAEQASTGKAKRLTLLFSNVSFVGPNSLAARLRDAGSVQTPDGPKPYSDNVFVSQVVPNYENDNSDVVNDYRKALASADQTPSFTSLEGYVTGRVFVAGLLAHKGAFSPEALIDTFERLPPLNLGLGASSGFSRESHDYSKSVFGTAITSSGAFVNRYFWSEGSSIQLFE